MAKDDYCYCKGVGCPLRDRCVPYVEGKRLPSGDWKWQHSCGEEKNGFLPIKKR